MQEGLHRLHLTPGLFCERQLAAKLPMVCKDTCCVLGAEAAVVSLGLQVPGRDY